MAYFFRTNVYLACRLQCTGDRGVPRKRRASRRPTRRHVAAPAAPRRREVWAATHHPVAYLLDGDRYVIFASKAGAPTNPAWYLNLKANPAVTIEVGAQTLDATASELVGAERERLFTEQAEMLPQFAGYAEKTDRVIPVVALTPVG